MIIESLLPRLHPPPHDPHERDVVTTIGAWEVRLFGQKQFDYFATRGFWHVQLWHPVHEVSILTPSRLTRGFYELYTRDTWKVQAASYEALVERVRPIGLPLHSEVQRIERVFVEGVVRSPMLALC